MRKSDTKEVVEDLDDLDSIIREREGTKRGTMMDIISKGGMDFGDLGEPTAGKEEELNVDDDFADFDYNPSPKKVSIEIVDSIVEEKTKFPSNSAYAQEKDKKSTNNSVVELPKNDSIKSNHLKDSRRGSLKNDIKDIPTRGGVFSKDQVPSKVTQVFLDSDEKTSARASFSNATNALLSTREVKEEEFADIDLDNINGRERTTMTIASNSLGNTVMMRNDFSMAQGASEGEDQRMVDKLASQIKEGQSQGMPTMNMKHVIQEINIDLSVSEEEDKIELNTPIKKRFTKRKDTHSKELKLEEDSSKLNSMFTARPKHEFEVIESEYTKEIASIKESTGKLNVDMDMIREVSDSESLSEIRIKDIRPNLYEYFKSKYGEIKCMASDKKGDFALIATKQQMVLFDKTVLENYASVQTFSDEDYPTCLYFDSNSETFIAGLVSGDLVFYKLMRKERVLKKLNVARGFSNTEILCIATCREMSHVIVVDAEYRVMHTFIESFKGFERYRVASTQVGYTKRDTLPHIAIHPLKNDRFLCTVTAGVEVTFYEMNTPAKNSPLKPCIQLSQFDVDLRHETSENSNLNSTDADNSRESNVSKHSETETWEITGTETDEQIQDLGMMKKKVFDDLESYPLMFDYEERRHALILAVAHNKTIYIYEINFTGNEKKTEQVLIDSIKIKNRLILFSLYTIGYPVILDCKLDTYVIDLKSILQQKLSGVKIRKSFLDDQRLKFRKFLQNSVEVADPTEEHRKSDGVTYYDKDSVFLIHTFGNEANVLRNITNVRKLISYSVFADILDTGEVMFVNKKGFYFLEIMDWKVYLNECIFSKKYFLVLRLINEMIDGENTQLRKMPNNANIQKELQPYIESILPEFILQLVLQQPKEIEVFTNYCMMTLFKYGMMKFLLKDLEKLMDENNLTSYYVESLCLFYKSQLIPQLDIEKIAKIINFLEYNPLEKQRFILFLFNKRVQREMLISNLATHGNTNLLFYISDKMEDPARATFVLEFLRVEFDKAEIDHKEDLKAKGIHKVFWYVFEFVHLKLEKRETKYKDHVWYVLHWIFDPNVIKSFVKHDLRSYLEGLSLIFEKNLTSLLYLNPGLKILEQYPPIENEIMDPSKTIDEMIFLFSHIYNEVKDDQRNLSYFYFFISMVKFKKTYMIELNDVHLKKLVFGLIKNINDIVSDPRISTIDKDDINILIFATFTEHKEIFVDNEELKVLIMENQ